MIRIFEVFARSGFNPERVVKKQRKIVLFGITVYNYSSEENA